MKLFFGSQNSRILNRTNFRFLKGVKIGFQKPYGNRGFKQMPNVKMKLIHCQALFKIFRALFGVRPRMRRLSQVLQIEFSCIKHELTVQIIFMSEMGVDKVRDRRNRRDNYLVSEIVSQLCNN